MTNYALRRYFSFQWCMGSDLFRKCFHTPILSLLHPEQLKLYRVSAVPSAIGLKPYTLYRISVYVKGLSGNISTGESLSCFQVFFKTTDLRKATCLRKTYKVAFKVPHLSEFFFSSSFIYCIQGPVVQNK